MHKTITELCKEAHETAVSKGWYDDPQGIPAHIALMHSELSEALEAYRSLSGQEMRTRLAEEFADTCIRIFDTCAYFGLDLESAIYAKMERNKRRQYKHGGKRI